MKLTIKESGRMVDGQVSELSPQYDSRKSFYGKAKVVVGNGKVTLYSYNTPVCEIDANTNEVTLLDLWDSSQTTLRHVKEFLQQHGFKAGSKQQLAKMYEVR
jgi:hypothetical protein